MGCGCHHSGGTTYVAPVIRKEPIVEQKQALIAPKSETKGKVKIRYYGGGMAYQSSGCHTCGGGGRYALTTSETIQFASDDEPGGWFSQRFDASHDYYVTEQQAAYLLGLTYTNPSGQVVHKFKKIED